MVTTLAKPVKLSPKRAATRQHLIETAISIFAEKGIEKTSVLEITQKASVSNGTFYYHFKDKDVLVKEVRSILMTTFIDELHAKIDTIEDPRLKIAYGIQWMTRRAIQSRELGWITAETLDVTGPLRLNTSDRMHQDVLSGIAKGYFTVDPIPLLYDILGRVSSLSLCAVLNGDDVTKVCLFGAEQHLRMLGVDAKTAHIFAVKAHEKLTL